jgi:hypothetical protein
VLQYPMYMLYIVLLVVGCVYCCRLLALCAPPQAQFRARVGDRGRHICRDRVSRDIYRGRCRGRHRHGYGQGHSPCPKRSNSTGAPPTRHRHIRMLATYTTYTTCTYDQNPPAGHTLRRAHEAQEQGWGRVWGWVWVLGWVWV